MTRPLPHNTSPFAITGMLAVAAGLLIIREGGDISEFGLWLAGMIAVGMLIAAVVTGAA